jgi:hypothetical protein
MSNYSHHERLAQLEDIENYCRHEASTTLNGKYGYEHYISDGLFDSISPRQAAQIFEYLKTGNNKGIAEMLFASLVGAYKNSAREYAEEQERRERDEWAQSVATGSW